MLARTFLILTLFAGILGVFSGTMVLRTEALLTSVANLGANTFSVPITGLQVAQGTFAKSTGAAPVTQSVTGLGFQPKAVVFFWTRQSAHGFTLVESVGVGVTDGTNQRAVATAEDHGVNRSNAGRRRSSSASVLFLADGSPTLAAQGELVSFDSDGFTLNWTTNEPRGDIVHYLAFAGPDLTNAAVRTFTLTGSTGVQAVTGTGFQPDVVFFLSGFDGAEDSNLQHGHLSIGLARSSTERGALSISARDNRANQSDKVSLLRTDAALGLVNSSGNQDALADFISLDGDGFTINKLDASGDRLVSYLALKGGDHKVGSLLQPTVSGLQPTSGLGFEPKGVLLFSRDKASGGSVDEPSTMSLGVGVSPSSRSSVWAEGLKNGGTSSTASYSSGTDIITMAGSPNVVDARADLASLDSDGFTLNWSLADSTAREIVYWAFK